MISHATVDVISPVMGDSIRMELVKLPPGFMITLSLSPATLHLAMKLDFQVVSWGLFCINQAAGSIGLLSDNNISIHGDCQEPTE